MKNRRVRVGVLLTGDKRMSAHNQRIFSKAKPTDVISVPIGEMMDETQEILGDIIIDQDEVKRNARRFKVAYKQELARVVAHGVLHLLGMDDETPKSRSAMKAIEDWVVTGIK